MKQHHRVILTLGFLVFATSAAGFVFTINPWTRIPIKWPSGPIVVQIKADAVTVLPGDGSTRAGTIQAATQLWNTHLGAVQLDPRVAEPGPAADRNGTTEIVFSPSMFGESFDARTLAVTYLRSDGNAATERDVIFNSNLTWDSFRGPVGSQAGAVDIRRVAVHELGHVLGLDHPDEANPAQSVESVMNSIVSNTIAPTTDDIAGAQVLYGPLGTPANDRFSESLEIVLIGATARATGHNTNATPEAGEPRHAGNNGGRSIWWRWLAPASGTVSVNTQGSVFDTTLGVYRGPALGTLVEVASDDDLEDGVIQYSTLSFSAVAGTLYHLAVDGFDGDTGAVVLNLAFTPAAASAPVILASPSSQFAAAGSSVTLGITAMGDPAPTFQWSRDGVALAGATEASLVFNPVRATDAGLYTVTLANVAGTVTSAPGRLTVLPRLHHAADSDRNFRFNLGELTRLIELYQTKRDGARTGAYRIEPLSEDGFGRDPALAPGAVAGLPDYHSIDTNRDGRVELNELVRAIELYNYRVGTVRTGQYHVAAGTEDGFATGP